MLKKIFKLSTFFLITIFITSLTFFGSASMINAAQMTSDDINENGMGIIIEESKDNLDSSQSSTAPDLGDDQTFPFIPGFGKNSGKD